MVDLKIKESLILAVLFSISMIVLPMLMVVVSNTSDFNAPILSILLFSIKYLLFVSILIFSILVILPSKIHFWAKCFILFVIFSSVIQYYFLSGSIGALDGNKFEFSTEYDSVKDVALYITSGVVFVLFRQKICSNVRAIGLWLVLFQFINFGMLAITNASNYQPYVSNIDTEGEISSFSKNNVLHIILDGFQAGLFQDIIDDEPDLRRHFDGFTYFKDTLASSPVTNLSFPAFLTGEPFKNESLISTYLEESKYAVATHDVLSKKVNILEEVALSGYEVDVSTPNWPMKNQNFYKNYYFIPTPYKGAREYVQSQLMYALDISLFMLSPKSLKKYVYSEGRWLLSRGELLKKSMHFSSTQFVENVIKNSRVEDRGNVYKLIHIISPHGPWVTEENCSYAGKELKQNYKNMYNQGKCALLTVTRLFEKLKILGIYNSSLIVVHADHGIALPVKGIERDKRVGQRSYPKYIGNTNPVLLIKRVGDKGDMKLSNAEALLTDLPKTISSLLNLSSRFSGVNLFLEVPSNRERYYYSSDLHRSKAAKQNYYDQLDEYEVSGPINSPLSWLSKTALRLDMKSHSTYPIKDFISVDSFGVTSDNTLWIKSSDLKSKYFLVLDDEIMISDFNGVDTITVNLQSPDDVEKICIINPVKEIKQCMLMTVSKE